MTAISPTQSNVLAALRSFLLDVLPAGYAVVAGQPNRVPEVQGGNFCVMTPIRMPRLATNLDSWADVEFTGSISGALMTVTAVEFGAIAAGATVFGTGVSAGTAVSSQASGTPGGVGVYVVSPAQAVGSETMGAGAQTYELDAEAVVQLDFHSADLTSGDAAQTVSTLLRDPYGTTFFAALPAPQNGVSPLYADDPAQRPFANDQAQIEFRWVLEAHLQVNQIVGVPQPYADSAEVDAISVQTLA